MDLLRHLGFFVAVAEEGHFGRAAERLGMTQPPVSQGVQRLERKLGVQLLSRGSRGVGLTPAGAELLPQAYALLGDAERFVAEAGRLRDRAARVGVIPQLSSWHVAALASSTPVTVTTASTVELVDAVTSGELDCAVVHHPALVNSLECGPVIKVPTWFLVPDGHDVSAVTDMRGLPFATAPRSHGTAAFDLFADRLRAAGLDPSFLPAVDDREIVAAVAAGRAFGVTCDPHLRAPGVVRVALDEEFSLRVRLVWRVLPPSVRDAITAALT
ncbi:LysR family transcriptional regulator [Kibdelosporangium persicum]|uniref:DNA-binding transcriptional LysR family regulator n=1 Tax=Kibdelosporangium persicum TaxID=2698649 RepID=A0ABX2FJ88_9PSEU|nr:LysR family transcriptional regulator [Kibdelosporangium persicum]NRN70937.1 DNA-binding transcriptional LysR family regulator [Kibdelosporangium persicum]